MAFNYKKNRAWAENLTIVMQIGLTMAGCIVFCFFVGLYLDKLICDYQGWSLDLVSNPRGGIIARINFAS